MANVHAPLVSSAYVVDDAFRTLLETAVRDGYIRTQVHPDLPLAIYNYTPAAQYERMWNPATLAARGLVLDLDGELVARPLPKFFNLEEVGPTALPAEPFRVYEKVDGSLLIATRYTDELVTATRGSFTSPQAAVGRELARDLADRFDDGITYLFEVIYPSNRIVCDYGDERKLVLLAAIETGTGYELLPHEIDLPVEKAEEHTPDVVDVTTGAAEERPNREGFVLLFSSGVRVKVKHEEYKRLHRVLTNVTSRTIWEYLKDGRPVTDLIDAVPDEFYTWVSQTVAGLEEAYRTVETAYRSRAVELLGDVFGQDTASWVLTRGDECREREIMYRGLLDGWRDELAAFAVHGFDHGSIIKRAEQFEQTKDPDRKQEKYDLLCEVITAPQRLGYILGLARKIVDNDERMAARMVAEREELVGKVRSARGTLFPQVRALADELNADLLWKVMEGVAYDRDIWAQIKPEVQAPFADRIAA